MSLKAIETGGDKVDVKTFSEVKKSLPSGHLFNTIGNNLRILFSVEINILFYIFYTYTEKKPGSGRQIFFSFK